MGQCLGYIFIAESEARECLHVLFFMEIFVIAAWEIWNIRKRKIFEGTMSTLRLWIFRFIDQTSLHMRRVRKSRYSDLFCNIYL